MIIAIHFSDPVGARDQCRDPGQVDNALRAPITSLSVGTVVTYTCNTGFNGGGSITCLPGGEWSGPKWSSPRPSCDGISMTV